MVTRKRAIFAIAVLIAAICMVAWVHRRPPALTYLRPEIVNNLSVTLADGTALPTEIGVTESLVIVIRFVPTDALPSLDSAVYAFILNEYQHYSDKNDVVEVHRQFPEGIGSPVTFVSQRDGVSVNIAPPAPPPGAGYDQWCSWINPRSFEFHRECGKPLELDLWLFPRHDRGTVRPPGIWFFRHRFQLKINS
jgi:hypothetical protein